MSALSYLPILDLLPADLPRDVAERRVQTAAALFRQALFTVETQGMPGEAVMAVARYVIESEAVSRASQAERAG